MKRYFAISDLGDEIYLGIFDNDTQAWDIFGTLPSAQLGDAKWDIVSY